MNEFELIDRHFRREPRNADVRVGIGDDGAVFAPSPAISATSRLDVGRLSIRSLIFLMQVSSSSSA